MCDFRLKLPFISETVGLRERGPWNVKRMSKLADRSVSVPMTLNNLGRRYAMVSFCQADLLNNSHTV